MNFWIIIGGTISPMQVNRYTSAPKLKEPGIIFLCTVIVILSTPALCQDEIEYGSNNGIYLSVSGTKLYYEEYGEGVPLILIHGGLSSMGYYRLVVPELSNHFRVILVDSPGHGRSFHADSLSYQLMADHFSEMIDLMDLDSVIVMGCSDGAIVALILAHDRPQKIKKVISDSGLSGLSGYTIKGLEWLKTFDPQSRNRNWVENYKKTNPECNRWIDFLSDAKVMWLQEEYITKNELGNIKCPTLLIMGDRDYFIPIAHGIQLHYAISNSELCILPDMGHAVCNKKPAIVNPILLDFLTKR